MATTRLIERLRLSVVCPAKAKVLDKKEGNITLMNSNYRLLGQDEQSLWQWVEEFKQAGLDLKQELRALVKQELGPQYDIEESKSEGYLGVLSNTMYKIVFPKKEH